jgi:hypothetical protein
MARRIVDENARVPGELRFKPVPEARGVVAECRMKPYVQRRVESPAGPDNGVLVDEHLDSIRDWTHLQPLV